MLESCVDEVAKQAPLHKIQLAKCGLLLNGRFSNLPPPLSIEVHRNLIADLQWIREQKKDGKSTADSAVIDSFQALKWVLLLSPVADVAEATRILGESSTSNASNSIDKIDLKQEEERAFAKHSVKSVLKRLDSQVFATECVVMSVVPIDKLEEAIQDMISMLAGMDPN